MSSEWNTCKLYTYNNTYILHAYKWWDSRIIIMIQYHAGLSSLPMFELTSGLPLNSPKLQVTTISPELWRWGLVVNSTHPPPNVLGKTRAWIPIIDCKMFKKGGVQLRNVVQKPNRKTQPTVIFLIPSYWWDSCIAWSWPLPQPPPGGAIPGSPDVASKPSSFSWSAMHGAGDAHDTTHEPTKKTFPTFFAWCGASI